MRTLRQQRKEMKLGHRVILTFATLTITMALSPTVTRAEFEGDIELLRAVATAYRANYDAIKTWQGEARIHLLRDIGDSEHQELVNIVSFAYSQRGNASRWNIRTIKSRYTLDGRKISAPDAGCYSGMLKGDLYYRRIVPLSQPEDVRGTLQIYKRTYALAEMLNSGFDPMYFLTDGSEPHDQRLLFLCENSQNPQMSGHYTITRNEDHVRLEESSPHNNCVTRLVYDLSQGGNLIEEYGSSPGGAIRFEYTYEQHDGAWVVKALAYENTSCQPGPSEDTAPIVMTLKKHFEWTTNTVNRPLSSDAFSLTTLGIRPGDRIVDHVRQIRFAYISDKGIEEPQDATPAPGLKRHRPARRAP